MNCQEGNLDLEVGRKKLIQYNIDMAQFHLVSRFKEFSCFHIHAVLDVHEHDDMYDHI